MSTIVSNSSVHEIEDIKFPIPILPSSSNPSCETEQQLPFIQMQISHNKNSDATNSQQQLLHQDNEQDSHDNHRLDASHQADHDLLTMPLIMAQEDSLMESGSIRSRNNGTLADPNNTKHNLVKLSKRHKRKHSTKKDSSLPSNRRWCCYSCPAPFVRSTLSVMNFLARVLFWCTVLATVTAIAWYSYELKNNGTDPHLIAWFSAGAFVLLGFPISMYGIVMHLANYNQPNIQMYIVRILWMVPLYSMESWLCLRFHRYAVYIETLRDVYESYVLYSFLQFLIQVLGGEEELILMLKDKSPTRGVHMWGLQWCVKPWLMGQPVSSTRQSPNQQQQSQHHPLHKALTNGGTSSNPGRSVQWTSPFFVKCKFGVLQYVLMKFVTSIFVMVLELNDLYREGDFSLSSGYLYICFLTNFSQCWALYCLIFFYLATKNELSPIRPVGKFLSVKALVFFTWWQSMFISLIYQMDLIPHYRAKKNESVWTSEDVAKGLQDYLICIEMFIGAIVHVFVFPHTDYLPEAVQARHQSSHRLKRTQRRQLGRRHQFINPQYHHPSHGTTTLSDIVMMTNTTTTTLDDSSATSKNSGEVELASQATSETLLQSPRIDEDKPFIYCEAPIIRTTNDSNTNCSNNVVHSDDTESNRDNDTDDDEELLIDGTGCGDADYEEEGEEDDSGAPLIVQKTGFVKALIDSTIPRDVIDQSVGIVKGDYTVEKKSLLSHAATSDQYDLFSSSRRFFTKATKQLEGKD